MIKDYEIKEKLGAGAYGVVFKVTKKNTKDFYVIKQISLFGMNQKEKNDATSEAKILSSIKSNYVVKYYDSFEIDGNLNIVMEFCNGGDLSEFIEEKKKTGRLLKEDLILEIFIKILIGLTYLHNKNILHRDLKTPNIFLTNGLQIKIGDLGVAKVLSHTSFAKTLIGTPYYLSPEICEEKPYNDKSDIWALGCILYELTTYKHPFDAKSQGALILKILSKDPEPIHKCYSDDLRNLITILLDKNYLNRPSCIDILKKNFILHKVKKFGLLNELISLGIIKQGNRTIPNMKKTNGKNEIGMKRENSSHAKNNNENKIYISPPEKKKIMDKKISCGNINNNEKNKLNDGSYISQGGIYAMNNNNPSNNLNNNNHQINNNAEQNNKIFLPVNQSSKSPNNDKINHNYNNANNNNVIFNNNVNHNHKNINFGRYNSNRNINKPNNNNQIPNSPNMNNKDINSNNHINNINLNNNTNLNNLNFENVVFNNHRKHSAHKKVILINNIENEKITGFQRQDKIKINQEENINNQVEKSDKKPRRGSVQQGSNAKNDPNFKINKKFVNQFSQKINIEIKDDAIQEIQKINLKETEENRKECTPQYIINENSFPDNKNENTKNNDNYQNSTLISNENNNNFIDNLYKTNNDLNKGILIIEDEKNGNSDNEATIKNSETISWKRNNINQNDDSQNINIYTPDIDTNENTKESKESNNENNVNDQLYSDNENNDVEENVKMLDENYRKTLRDSLTLDKKTLFNKITKIKKDLLELIGENDYNYIMNLYSTINENMTNIEEVYKKIEDFATEKYEKCPEKKEKFEDFYLLLVSSENLVAKKEQELKKILMM